MEHKKLAVHVDEALRGVGHGGKVDVRVLINEDTVGARSFSLLVNTVKAGDSCAAGEEANGHKHEIEHGLYCLSGRGSMVIGGARYPLRPDTAVFVPANELHYVDNESTDEDLKYIIIYVPAGEEKQFLSHK
jgi:mannose-6-phosphate isomerase-like protein (cupin superfamily)